MGRTSNSQQRLLTAASDLLWEKSYHSVTVDEVCARAGVEKGSLYHFFDSKSALTLAALQHFWTTVAKPAYEKHFSPAIPPLARFTNFLTWLEGLQREKFRNIGRVLGWPFFTLGCELGTQEPTVGEELREIEAAELWYFESAIRNALDQNVIGQTDPRAQALSFRAAVDGLLARARFLNDPDELSALAGLPINMLFPPKGNPETQLHKSRPARVSDVPPSTVCFVCRKQIVGDDHIRFYRALKKAKESASAQIVTILLCSSTCAFRYFATLEQEMRNH